jgi:large subunit ribosomal protein L30
VTDKAPRTIRIKWVRSAIAFPYRQKVLVRSLGLLRLNQVVARPDTPQIRGLVARIPHLVEVVEPPVETFRFSVPEYTLFPPEAKPVKPAPPSRKEEVEIAAGEPEAAKVSAEGVKEKKEKKETKEKAAAPAKAAKAKKAPKPAEEAKKKAVKGEDKKKAKPAAKSGKSTKSSKK